MLKKTGQGQAGPVDVQGPQGYVLIVGGGTQNLQVEFLYDLPQFYTFLLFRHSFRLLSSAVFSAVSGVQPPPIISFSV